MQDYHQLDLWNRAMDYVVAIYRFAATLPAEEKFNLTSQLRRAAVSVPLNVAEGCGSTSKADFARFLSFGYRPLKEVVTCLELCQRLYPASRARSLSLVDEGNEISRMTYRLMQKVVRKF